MKKIPEPLYPCKYCADEYSWPAKDLHWSEESQDWVCRECWEYSEECEQGISLADEIKAQATEPKELGLDYEVPEKVPKCNKCGYGLTQVRPGKYQCDNMYCRL